MRLSHLMQEDFFIFRLKSKTKEDAITEIVSRFSEDQKENKDIIEAILERESISSTLFENTGVMIPHARKETFKDFYVGMGISEEGIEMENMVGKKEKAHIVLLIASSPLKNQVMLNVMASFATAMKKDPALTKKIINSKTPDEALKILEGIKTGTKMEFDQLVNKEILSISPNASLKEAVTTMVDKNLFYLPVVDDKGNFLGEITDGDILHFATPDYILRIDNLRFVVEDEPFEKFLLQERNVVVSDVMNSYPLSADPESSIIEVVSLMLKNSKRYLYVLDGKKLIGIVSQKDIVKKILFA